MLMRSTAVIPLILVSALALLAAGCNKQPKTGNDTEEDAAFLVEFHKVKADSLWQGMMASNNAKIANTAYFLKVASDFLPDTIRLAALQTENEQLKAKRYTQIDLRDRIDSYDSAENHILQGLGDLFNTYPAIQIVNTSKALEEIKAADDSVLIYRYMYDKEADAYNMAIIQNKKNIDKATKPLPVFRLNP